MNKDGYRIGQNLSFNPLWGHSTNYGRCERLDGRSWENPTRAFWEWGLQTSLFFLKKWHIKFWCSGSDRVGFIKFDARAPILWWKALFDKTDLTFWDSKYYGMGRTLAEFENSNALEKTLHMWRRVDLFDLTVHYEDILFRCGPWHGNGYSFAAKRNRNPEPEGGRGGSGDVSLRET